MNRREALTVAASAVLGAAGSAVGVDFSNPDDSAISLVLTNKTAEPLSMDLYGLKVYKGARWLCELRYKMPGRRMTLLCIESDEPKFESVIDGKWDLKVEAKEPFEWSAPEFKTNQI